jgi:hypothetical protein
MDYALVIRALERHVGIAERSMQFFRERIMNRQYHDAVIITQEATRALHEVKKQRDLYELQKSLYQARLGPPPDAIPNDKPLQTEATAVEKDFPDEPLQDAAKREIPDASPLKPI